MSIVGRRGSSGSGWTWPRTPSGPRRPPPRPPQLLLAGAALVTALTVLAVLLAWLSDVDVTAIPAATSTPTVTVAPPPSPTATAAPTPTPAPTPAPTAGGPLFHLGAWDGAAWRFDSPLRATTYREGEALPFILRVDRARPGEAYRLVIRYDCRGFDFLTAYDRDTDSSVTLAPGGPSIAVADAAMAIPGDPGTPADDAEEGRLSLWGGAFAESEAPLPASACSGEKSWAVRLTAAADTLFLLWGGLLSPEAAEGTVPLRMTVTLPDIRELAIEIVGGAVGPAQP